MALFDPRCTLPASSLASRYVPVESMISTEVKPKSWSPERLLSSASASALGGCIECLVISPVG